MGAIEYNIATKQNFSLTEWVSIRMLLGLLAGVAVFFGAEPFLDNEPRVIGSIAALWLVGGLSSKILFSASALLLLGIMVLSFVNADAHFGNEKAVNILARWLLFCMSIGIMRQVSDMVFGSKKRPRGNRSLVKILPTAARSQLNNTLMPLSVQAPHTHRNPNPTHQNLPQRHNRPINL